MIRRILIDHARSRGFAKRGGDAQRLPLDQVLVSAQARGIDVLALDDGTQHTRPNRCPEKPSGGTALLWWVEHRGNGGSPRSFTGYRQTRLAVGQGVAPYRAFHQTRVPQVVIRCCRIVAR